MLLPLLVGLTLLAPLLIALSVLVLALAAWREHRRLQRYQRRLMAHLQTHAQRHAAVWDVTRCDGSAKEA